MPHFIPLCAPYLDELDAEAVKACVHSTFVSSVGPLVTEFEQRFAKNVGSDHGVACSSGTSALHLALMAAKIHPGDEVLVPTFTFSAGVNPVIYCNATPVFVDAESRTMNPDPEIILKEIDTNSNLKAVIGVHLYGIPMSETLEIARKCREKGIVFIEDATESLGAEISDADGHAFPLGTIGDYGCFSFNGNKIITCGGGGMVVCSDEQSAAYMKHLSTQARLAGLNYEHDVIGYNYRLTNLQASLALSQLLKLVRLLEIKRTIFRRYREELSDIKGLAVFTPPQNVKSSYWMTNLLVDAPDGTNVKLIEHLRANGIESRPLWKPLHDQKPYRKYRSIITGVGENLFHRGLSIPSSCGMTPQDQNHVIKTLHDFF
ncbi:aminotransferase class I/II-fold pyridoxal phosphate-dependent enzyme [Myxococcota bacterium]|nr:aminotransferase class I/II-fold pyridoxal phosphate-dependent enzyme [Myxococcota bacterium]MBU1382302.1 aminotransferase class I/II-fold pyridoxal phosphate-dependent enzyme [Myxococcota bacterium]MBU1496356.1 aminotransferase class I/II-fold pyridoxal phosphate-dependent enzyme [Myxococcota bacterium]